MGANLFMGASSAEMLQIVLVTNSDYSLKKVSKILFVAIDSINILNIEVNIFI